MNQKSEQEMVQQTFSIKNFKFEYRTSNWIQNVKKKLNWNTNNDEDEIWHSKWKIEIPELSLKSGFIAIVGISGSGKSTLLSILGGLEKLSAEQGTNIVYTGVDGAITNFASKNFESFRRKTFGYIFQHCYESKPLTSIKNVTLPLYLRHLPQHKIETFGEQLLEVVRMENLANVDVNTLSGGQLSRIGILRGIAQTPKVLLVDEPAASLDEGNALHIMELIKQWQKQTGGTVIMVTHYLRHALKYANQIVVIEQHEGISKCRAPYHRPSGEVWAEQDVKEIESMIHFHEKRQYFPELKSSEKAHPFQLLRFLSHIAYKNIVSKADGSRSISLITFFAFLFLFLVTMLGRQVGSWLTFVDSIKNNNEYLTNFNIVLNSGGITRDFQEELQSIKVEDIQKWYQSIIQDKYRSLYENSVRIESSLWWKNLVSKPDSEYELSNMLCRIQGLSPDQEKPTSPGSSSTLENCRRLLTMEDYPDFIPVLQQYQHAFSQLIYNNSTNFRIRLKDLKAQETQSRDFEKVINLSLQMRQSHLSSDASVITSVNPIYESSPEFIVAHGYHLNPDKMEALKQDLMTIMSPQESELLLNQLQTYHASARMILTNASLDKIRELSMARSIPKDEIDAIIDRIEPLIDKSYSKEEFFRNVSVKFHSYNQLLTPEIKEILTKSSGYKRENEFLNEIGIALGREINEDLRNILLNHADMVSGSPLGKHSVLRWLRFNDPFYKHPHLQYVQAQKMDLPNEPFYSDSEEGIVIQREFLMEELGYPLNTREVMISGQNEVVCVPITAVVDRFPEGNFVAVTTFGFGNKILNHQQHCDADKKYQFVKIKIDSPAKIDWQTGSQAFDEAFQDKYHNSLFTFAESEQELSIRSRSMKNQNNFTKKEWHALVQKYFHLSKGTYSITFGTQEFSMTDRQDVTRGTVYTKNRYIIRPLVYYLEQEYGEMTSKPWKFEILGDYEQKLKFAEQSSVIRQSIEQVGGSVVGIIFILFLSSNIMINIRNKSPEIAIFRAMAGTQTQIIYIFLTQVFLLLLAAYGISLVLWLASIEDLRETFLQYMVDLVWKNSLYNEHYLLVKKITPENWGSEFLSMMSISFPVFLASLLCVCAIVVAMMSYVYWNPRYQISKILKER
ncbi:MAG: ATP-binding cassette domain-containing protein [SAR324 cluster bacterium]|nr:ATP-binding cassette domain-containing protein [SAR324 cluster bacterium]